MKEGLKLATIVALACALGWIVTDMIQLVVIHERHETMRRTFWNGTPFDSKNAVIYWSPNRGLAHHVCTTVECYPFYEDTGYRCVSTGGNWDELTGCER